MKTFRFLQFPVYQQANSLYQDVIKETKGWKREYWELGDQTRRAILSVCLNIAEGSAKRSDRDFNRYIENSLGSVNEFVACCHAAFKIGLLKQRKYDYYLSEAKSIANQLGGLSKKLRSTS